MQSAPMGFDHNPFTHTPMSALTVFALRVFYGYDVVSYMMCGALYWTAVVAVLYCLLLWVIDLASARGDVFLRLLSVGNYSRCWAICKTSAIHFVCWWTTMYWALTAYNHRVRIPAGWLEEEPSNVFWYAAGNWCILIHVAVKLSWYLSVLWIVIRSEIPPRPQQPTEIKLITAGSSTPAAKTPGPNPVKKT